MKTANADPNSNGKTAADDEKEYQVPERYLRISQSTREFAVKPRQYLLRSLYQLGQAIQADLEQDPHIHLSEARELQLLAETAGEHPDSLESCIRLTTIFTEADFERIVNQSFLSFSEIVSLSYVPSAEEREELLQLAIKSKWSGNELYKEIRRRYPLPPKNVRPNPPPRSVKQARERLCHQSKKFLELLQKLFGKFGYDLATEILHTPPGVIKSELPNQIAECIEVLRVIGAMTARCAQELEIAAGYAGRALAVRAAQSVPQTETALADQGDLTPIDGVIGLSTRRAD
jgi:hypothetical protein